MRMACCELLQKINEISFALDDVTLYLDTHPCDQNALAYYQHVANMRREALEAYEAACGPLLSNHVTADNYWCWINSPWPWEGGCN